MHPPPRSNVGLVGDSAKKGMQFITFISNVSSSVLEETSYSSITFISNVSSLVLVWKKRSVVVTNEYTNNDGQYVQFTSDFMASTNLQQDFRMFTR